MVYNNILESMGNTPLVRLNRLCPQDSAEMLVKVESLNIGGSIKSRTALRIIPTSYMNCTPVKHFRGIIKR